MPVDIEPSTAGPAPAPAHSVEDRTERVIEDQAPMPVDIEPSMAVPAPAPDHDRERLPPPEATSAGGPAGSVASRQVRFEEALNRLEHTMQSVSTWASLPPEYDAALERIGLRKDKALEAHNEGDTDSALRLLTDAEREAGEIVREENARYRLNLQAAKEAYAAGNAAAARMHIEHALEYRPEDPETQLWEVRIKRLPELLAERRKAEDARGAGRLHEERAALRRIVELDPEDLDAVRRARTVDRQIHAQAFARTIAQGRRSVEERALEQAQQALAEAQRQEPQHADTRQLHTQVAALERILTRDRHLADAERATVQDDWEAALHAFEEARAIDATHDRAVSGSRLAARLVNVQRAVDEFLSRPERLGSSAVAGAAREVLREAVALTALSARLARSAEGLERAIEAGQTPVAVRVLSDDRTEIGIRGVGMVGRTRERTIELRPGQYVFEGKRRGYRTKLVEVVVQANLSAPVEVRIVCDERS